MEIDLASVDHVLRTTRSVRRRIDFERPVERRTLEVAVSSAGIVEPIATVEVKSKASGEVLDLAVEVGDLVDEGSLMVSIDPRIVRNRLAQAEALVRQRELEYAARERLKTESYVSEAQLQEAIALLETCLLYTSPSPRDRQKSRMPSSA